MTLRNSCSASARRPRCRSSRPTVRAVISAPWSIGFSRQPIVTQSNAATSEMKVFTLYWRPLRRLLAFTLTLAGCHPSPAEPPLFAFVAPESSGVTFANMLPPEDSAVNIVTYLYYYNGGGVAAGDIHGGGLGRLYFTSNLGPNPLYRNLGHFQFDG